MFIGKHFGMGQEYMKVNGQERDSNRNVKDNQHQDCSVEMLSVKEIYRVDLCVCVCAYSDLCHVYNIIDETETAILMGKYLCDACESIFVSLCGVRNTNILLTLCVCVCVCLFFSLDSMHALF